MSDDHAISISVSSSHIHEGSAAFLLSQIWRDARPEYSSIAICTDTLYKNKDLYEALKEAHSAKNYDSIRTWVIPPGTTSPNCAVHHDIEEFLTELRPTMEKRVSGVSAIETWDPKDLDVDPLVAAHITKLDMPLVSWNPDVLLHELGTFKDDPVLLERLNTIFVPDSHTLLVNASGSGKTRLLLEGLCDHWGFYLTTFLDSSQLGSADLQKSIDQCGTVYSSLSRDLTHDNPHWTKALLWQNRDIAERKFSEVFLARLLIFQLFLEIMHEDPSSVQDQRTYKLRWLLLQLRPHSSSAWDMFYALYSTFSKASKTYIDEKTTATLLKVRKLCSDPSNEASNPPPWFCVLDNGYYAAQEYPTAFRSHENNTDHRPILQEIVRTFEMRSSDFPVSTVIAMRRFADDIVDVPFSSFKYRWTSNTGDFGDSDAQKKYVSKYLPPSLAESKSGKRLLERVEYWLHGRYRFTAAFVTDLIRTGFKWPHRLLNEYVKVYTGLEPADAAEFALEEGKESINRTRWGTLDLSQLKRDPELFSTVNHIAHDYLTRSLLPTPLGKDGPAFVEHGVARFVDPEAKIAVIDEPLVLAGSTQWINENSEEPTFKQLLKQVQSPDSGSEGFENFVMFSLLTVINSKRHLCDVFSFGEETPEWADQTATVVALHRTQDGGFECSPHMFPEPYAYPQSSVPSAALGIGTQSPDETGKWLEHGCHASFCFPESTMGPSILFSLKLADESLIWVAVSAQSPVGDEPLSLSDLQERVRRVTPSKFFVKKDGTPLSPELPTKTHEQLLALPNKNMDVGKYSLLRVIAARPAQTNLARLKEEEEVDAADKDGHHPIASLNIDLVKCFTEGITPLEWIEREEKAAPKTKRPVIHQPAKTTDKGKGKAVASGSRTVDRAPVASGSRSGGGREKSRSRLESPVLEEPETKRKGGRQTRKPSAAAVKAKVGKGSGLLKRASPSSGAEAEAEVGTDSLEGGLDKPTKKTVRALEAKKKTVVKKSAPARRGKAAAAAAAAATGSDDGAEEETEGVQEVPSGEDSEPEKETRQPSKRKSPLKKASNSKPSTKNDAVELEPNSTKTRSRGRATALESPPTRTTRSSASAATPTTTTKATSAPEASGSRKSTRQVPSKKRTRGEEVDEEEDEKEEEDKPVPAKRARQTRGGKGKAA